MSLLYIVDDEPDIRSLIQTIAKNDGHKTKTAVNGEELLKLLEKRVPDLVLLDVMMPGLTTTDIFAQIKKRGFEDVKIVLVTVVEFTQAEKQLLLDEDLVVDYVPKPFGVEKLSKVIKKHL